MMCAYNTVEFNPPAPRKSQRVSAVSAQVKHVHYTCQPASRASGSTKANRYSSHLGAVVPVARIHLPGNIHSNITRRKKTTQHIHVIIVTDHEMDTGGVKRMLRDCSTAKRTQRPKNTMMTRVPCPDIIGYTHTHRKNIILRGLLCVFVGIY